MYASCTYVVYAEDTTHRVWSINQRRMLIAQQAVHQSARDLEQYMRIVRPVEGVKAFATQDRPVYRPKKWQTRNKDMVTNQQV